MVFELAFMAMLFYSLQNVFLAPLFRGLDRFQVIALRGASLFVIVGVVCLCTVPDVEWAKLAARLPRFIFIGMLGCTNVFLFGTALRELPVGIASASAQSTIAAGVAVGGVLLTNDSLSWFEIGCLAVLMLLILTLGKLRSMTVFAGRTGLGISLALISGLGSATTTALSGSEARIIHPFLASMAWEGSIGLAASLICIIRYLRGSLAAPGARSILLVFGASAPAAVGSICATTALQRGPMGFVGAILSTGLVASALLSRVLFKERLTPPQWVIVGLVAGVLGLMKVLG